MGGSDIGGDTCLGCGRMKKNHCRTPEEVAACVGRNASTFDLDADAQAATARVQVPSMIERTNEYFRGWRSLDGTA